MFLCYESVIRDQEVAGCVRVVCVRVNGRLWVSHPIQYLQVEKEFDKLSKTLWACKLNYLLLNNMSNSYCQTIGIL